MNSNAGERPLPRLRRLEVKGVLWRKVLDWSAENIPFYLEPIFTASWSLVFLVFATAGRRALLFNLRLLFPAESGWKLRLRAFRVFWNYAWTLSDAARARAGTSACDWDLEGIEDFHAACDENGGVIVMTAHMGSYDLGAGIFAEKVRKKIVMVRAPEPDEATQAYAEQKGWGAGEAGVQVGFNRGGMLSLDLLEALRRNEAVAIQGDRCPAGTPFLPARMFDREIQVPSGPFALALASGAPILPLFVVRLGRRRYLIRAGHMIRCPKTGRDRNKDMLPGAQAWCAELERVAKAYWYQWYCFEPVALANET